jgi:CheY-like chemotaxis protein
VNAAVRVLFVDDEPNVLEGIQRGLRKRVELVTATGGIEGLKLVKETGPFAVIVSDMRMPEMNGVQFLSKVRDFHPESVRIILSGQSDMEATIAAINEGHIFRFLSKPCPIDRLWEGVEAGIEQYRLITAEKALLEHTLSGAAKMLVEILGMVSPVASSRANRLQQYVSAMSGAIGTSERWQLPLAAILSQIGCVALPKDTLSKIDAGQAISDDEKRLFESHPEVAGKLLAAIPRLDDVAAIVSAQRVPAGPTAGQSDPRLWDIKRLGQTLLHAASEFDRQLSHGVRISVALDSLRAPSLGLTAPMIEALRTIPAETDKTVQRMVRVGELTIGMVFEEDVMSAKGMRLVPAGHEVTASLLVRLHSIAAGVGIVEPMRVRAYA